MLKLTKAQKGGLAALIIATISGLTYGLTRKVKAAPKEIKLSNLIISPTEVNPDQEVTISTMATNRSDTMLSKIVQLYIGGVLMEQKIVTLDPGKSALVTFSYTPTLAPEEEEKVFIVRVNGLTGSFVCTRAPVAHFILTDFVITPPECYAGETVEISVMLLNEGNARGSYPVTCQVEE